MGKLYKNYIFDIIVALVALALGVVMLPVFGISAVCIDLLIALALVAYLVLIIYDKLKRTQGTAFALTAVEFGFLSLQVLMLIIQQFSALHIATVCQFVGVVLLLRGVVMALTLYISAMAYKKPRRELAAMIIALLMTVTGTYLAVSPYIDEIILEWVMCIALFIAALAFAALAFLFHHPKTK